MTKRQIELCVRKWQRRLHLEDLEIEVDFDTPADEEGAVAIVDKSWDYAAARIRFAPTWPKWTPERVYSDDSGIVRSLDRLVVHELLHLVTKELDWSTTQKLLDGHLHRDVEELAEAAYGHALEGAVEAIARALAEAYGEG